MRSTQMLNGKIIKTKHRKASREKQGVRKMNADNN